MRKHLVALVVVVCVAGWADASALLIQDTNPWGLTANQDDMTALGISYAQSDYASADWSALCPYDFVLLVAGDGNGNAYTNYAIPNLAALEAYVTCGGLLLIHYAPYNVEFPGAGVIAPGGVQSSAWAITEDVNIDPGYAADPLVSNVTDASLDNWLNSSHVWLTNLVGGTETVLQYADGSGPSYVRYNMGAGEVWLTGMPLEWWNADPDVLYNELSMAGQWVNPCVPEPTALVSLCAGLALLGGYGARKRS